MSDRTCLTEPRDLAMRSGVGPYVVKPGLVDLSHNFVPHSSPSMAKAANWQLTWNDGDGLHVQKGRACQVSVFHNPLTSHKDFVRL